MKGMVGREHQLLQRSHSSFNLQQKQQLTFLCVFHFMCFPDCPWSEDHNPTAELGTTQENLKLKKNLTPKQLKNPLFLQWDFF